MKIKWDKKYTTIAIYAAVVILISVLIVFFFFNFHDFESYFNKIGDVLSPIIIGCIIAYMLNPIMKNVFEKRVFGFLSKKKKNFVLKRILSVTCTMLCFAAFIIAFIFMLVPQIRSGYSELVGNIGVYINQAVAWLEGLSENFSNIPYATEAINKLAEYVKGLLNATYDIMSRLLPSITSFVQSVFTGVYKALLGIVFSVYFLMSKEKICAQIKKLFRAVTSDKIYGKLSRTVSMADDKCGAYIRGIVASSLFVGALCFIGCWILGIPYYPLISLIVCVTNVIPIFGPFIGAIPGAFIVFITYPVKTIWFILLILVIQQIDGNIFVPKVMGDNMGIESTWVIVAITVMSGFFGLPGMLIGVPIFSVLYNLIREGAEKKLASRELSTELVSYYDTDMGRELFRESDEKDKRKEERAAMRKEKRAALKAASDLKKTNARDKKGKKTL